MRAVIFALLSCFCLAVFSPPDDACAKRRKKQPVARTVDSSSLSGQELVQHARNSYDHADFNGALVSAQQAEAVLERGVRTKESDACLSTAKCIIADMLVIKRQGGDRSISLDDIREKIREGLRLAPGKVNDKTSFRNPETWVYVDSVVAGFARESIHAYNSAKQAFGEATYCQRWKDLGDMIQFYPDSQLAAALVEDTRNKCVGPPPLGNNGILCLPFVIKDKSRGAESGIAESLTPSFVINELKAAFRDTAFRVISVENAANYMMNLNIDDWGEFDVRPVLRFVKDNPVDLVPSRYFNVLPKIYRHKLQAIARKEGAKWVCLFKVESIKAQGQDMEVSISLYIFDQGDPVKPLVSISKRAQNQAFVLGRFREVLQKGANEFSKLQ